MSLLQQKDGELQAQEIMNAINSEYDVDLDNVRINGDLILSVAEATKFSSNSAASKISFEEPRQIKSLIRFNHCVFEGIVDFANTIFSQEVSFDGSSFKQDILFCSRSGGTPLKSAEFKREASFHNTHFHKYADFNSVNFRGKAKFQESEFKETSNHNHVDFSCARFGEDANFVRSHFFVEARFDHARFHGITTFSSGTIFHKDANFRDAIFYERVRFFGCRFIKNANFKDANFDRDVILSRSNFDGNLNLSGSRMKIIKLDGVSFSNESSISSVFLKDSYFDRIFIEWNTLKDHLTTLGNDDAAFLALIKNFNDLGRFDDADNCRIYYKTKFKR